MLEIKNSLFPCDLTKDTSKILPYVLSFSEQYDSTIYVLHVVQGLQRWGELVDELQKWSSLYNIRGSLRDDMHKEAIESGKNALDKLCEENLQSYPKFQKRIVLGDPATEILKTIESENIDLVVMGTYVREGLEKIIVGSVTNKVVAKSPVPVITINPATMEKAT